ncbi:hypothetical protein NKH16_15265 [Mesorhizobium sp. M1307]|uniref:hypothetical protein n=1 Tax=unclassified Mesorhizobium TaxID=325217 RepID=UPI003335C34A
MAFAMVDLDHHRRAAAKRPFEFKTSGLLPELVDQIGSNGEKPPPFGRTTAMDLDHQAAS